MATSKKAVAERVAKGSAMPGKGPRTGSSGPTKGTTRRTPAATKAVPSTRKSTTAKKAAPAKKAAGVGKDAPAAEKLTPKKGPAKKATPPATQQSGATADESRATKSVAPESVAAETNPALHASTASSRSAARQARAAAAAAATPPPVRGVSKDGVAYTKDFDVKFLTAQRDLLLSEKASLLGQAVRLEDEVSALIEESEMGDVQFDDEGGEGDTTVVERERDLALSAQARQTIADIDAALERITAGTYGYSVESARPISRERLEALPWASVLVEEKVGGIGRR